MQKKFLGALGMALVLMTGTMAMPVQVCAKDYQDREAILDTGFVLDTDYTLQLANPSEDISTTESYYYITGSSDPDDPLTCNGEEVADRGIYGSFGIYASLEMGENEFVFENGEDTVSLTITRTEPSTSGGGIATITNLRRMGPSSDDIAKAGDTYQIRCTAPANGEVTATIGGETYVLEQEAIATTGVEAYYSTEITLPDVADGQVENLGQIQYKLTFDGTTSSGTSEGDLYVTGKDAYVIVRVNQNSAILYEDGEDGSNHVSLLSPGAVDAVVDCTDGYFQLSMGSWISKSYVDILEDQTEWADTVTDTSYTVGDDGEYLVLSGNASPSFKAYNTSEKVTIRFYNTTGIELDRINSNLFSSMTIREEDSNTTLEFYKRDSVETVGYDISYDGNGNTTVFFNPKASVGSESAPLKNMTIVVDPGHGGLDGGAQGVLYGIGPVEKDITMAHALVLQNRLESLGAEVILAVSPDQDNSTKVEMTDRVELAKENEADFYISLHCNSIAANSNGLKPSGTEIYYYENNSKLLADSILEKITEYNNRDARKVIYGNFYVTRNPICPSMLVEMGFISNPVEYDELCSPDSMYQTANAIADALIEYVEE